MNGHRSGEFNDALPLGMDVHAYIFKMEFTHEGAADCCNQLLIWRFLFIALREHYIK